VREPWFRAIHVATQREHVLALSRALASADRAWFAIDPTKIRVSTSRVRLAVYADVVCAMVRSLRRASVMLSLRSGRLRRSLRVLPLTILAAAITASAIHGAHAEESAADKAEAAERCSIRISVALVGKSPDATLFSSADPQAAVDAMLKTPEFADRYARFINSRFNGGPATAATDDPVYYLAKYVVANEKPWSDLFIGGYDVVANTTAMDVNASATGLGYFMSDSWKKRYAGNEPAGMMLSASFRILSNTTGLTLTPSVGQPGDDRTATGRSVDPCKSCHFDQWFALDKFARLLPTKKTATDGTITFAPPTAGPQALLGKSIANESELVQTLVASDAWKFAQCRNVFQFLYGRNENQCEAPVFDACVTALESQKTIQSAVAAVAKDPSFCK
jgi:hypothetical protein